MMRVHNNAMRRARVAWLAARAHCKIAVVGWLYQLHFPLKSILTK